MTDDELVQYDYMWKGDNDSPYTLLFQIMVRRVVDVKDTKLASVDMVYDFCKLLYLLLVVSK